MHFLSKNNNIISIKEVIYNCVNTLICIAAISPLLIGVKLYYVLMILCAIINIYIFCQSKKKHVDKLIIFFLVSIFISIAININRIEVFFSPLQRFAAFLCFIIGCSGLLYSKRNLIFQRKIYNVFIYAFIVISLISTILYQTTGFGLSNEEGGFNVKGFADHPNHLSYMGGISAIYFFILITEKRNFLNKILIALLGLISINCAFIGGARTAVFSMLFCLLLIIIIKSHNIKKLFFYISCIVIVALGLIKFEMLDLRAVNAKMTYAEKENSITASRNLLWEYRLKEFQSAPLFGVGAFSVDTRIVKKFYSNKTGQIEGGSTYLTVLSMTGIVGFIIFIIIILKPLYKEVEYVIKYKYQIESKRLFYIIIFTYNLILLLQTAILFNSGFYYSFFFWLSLSSLQFSKIDIYEQRTNHLYR